MRLRAIFAIVPLAVLPVGVPFSATQTASAASATSGTPPTCSLEILERYDVKRIRQILKVYYIPSASMAPTLQPNDRMVVDMTAYRSQPPQRGDIVVFNPTEALRQQNFDDPFTKRIMGLPGETLAVKRGKVYIGDRPITEPYISEPPGYEYGPVRIPPNSYAVFGDNRNNAYDSHYWGFVPRSLLIGKVICIYRGGIRPALSPPPAP